jgi:uncharacterized phage-associated protein
MLIMSQAVSVAKEFVKLSLSGGEKDPLTNLRLQKLLYYAQAWSLVVRQSELFSDDLHAAATGPVVPTVFQKLAGASNDGPIPPMAFADVAELSEQEAEFVIGVWEAYKQFSATELSRLTLQDQPWKRARGDRPPAEGAQDTISVNELEEFFATRPMPAPFAAYYHEMRKREELAEKQLTELAPLDAGRLVAAASSVTPQADLRLQWGLILWRSGISAARSQKGSAITFR